MSDSMSTQAHPSRGSQPATAAKVREIGNDHRDDETSSSGGSDSDVKQNGGNVSDAIESTSSSGCSDSDSDFDDDEDEEEDEVVLDEKPTRVPEPPSTDIHNRLTSFFSQLAEQRANPTAPQDDVIEEGSDSGFEDEDDNRHYVQLDLALGVLSEGAAEGSEEVKLPENHGNDGSSSGAETDSDDATIEKLKSISTTQRNPSKSTAHKRKVEELG